MHFCLITEAWHPQVNGVVRTWSNVVRELEAMGHRVRIIHPELFRTVAMPGYAEVRLAGHAGAGDGEVAGRRAFRCVAHRHRGTSGHGGEAVGVCGGACPSPRAITRSFRCTSSVIWASRRG